MVANMPEAMTDDGVTGEGRSEERVDGPEGEHGAGGREETSVGGCTDWLGEDDEEE